MFKMLRKYYHGITEDDFIDLSKMGNAQAETYCADAAGVFDSVAFQTELLRLRYKQEKYIAMKAQGPEDLLFGRAVLYTIEEIQKRFGTLAARSESKSEDNRRETSAD